MPRRAARIARRMAAGRRPPKTLNQSKGGRSLHRLYSRPAACAPDARQLLRSGACSSVSLLAKDHRGKLKPPPRVERAQPLHLRPGAAVALHAAAPRQLASLVGDYHYARVPVRRAMPSNTIRLQSLDSIPAAQHAAPRLSSRALRRSACASSIAAMSLSGVNTRQ